MKTIKKKGLIFISLAFCVAFFFITLTSPSSTALSKNCTTLTLTRNNKIYFCGNEDYNPQHMRMWFYPATADKYGTILYGFMTYDVFNPLAGMNDQGLACDEMAVPFTPVKRDPNKIDYTQTHLFVKILEECANVNEVIQWVSSYNLVTFEMSPVQVQFADITGNAVILGLDSNGETHITYKQGDYLLGTNFNVAQGRQPDWRYDAAEKILKGSNKASIEYCTSILEATAQGTSYSWYTKYSYIIDLNTETIYFYWNRDFSHFAMVNVNEELAKGVHSYDIATYVSQHGNKPFNMAPIIYGIVILGLTLIGCSLIWMKKIRPQFKHI